jgi:hypothetical protein
MPLEQFSGAHDASHLSGHSLQASPVAPPFSAPFMPGVPHTVAAVPSLLK